MNSLRIAENIVKYRKKKGVTQEEMAYFLGVTKASVSKWENEQSMPDIMMLPQLATYFDVTVDDLLGYEPQLSKEQIQKIYSELGKEFSEKDFEQVFERSEGLVKKYYSCYSFLVQICVLWMNHYMLAEGQKRQQQILEKIEELGNHIQKNCKEPGICNDVIILKASVNLMQGKPECVIENLGELISPYRLMNQSDGVLIQAYMMAGDAEKADGFAQISMYLHLLQLVSSAVQYLTIHMQEKDKCDETIKRIDKVMEVYHMGYLHGNVASVYQYQVAIIKCMQGEDEEALRRLRIYAEVIRDMLSGEAYLHGDDYFTGLEPLFDGLDLGTQMVRDKKIVMQSARQGLEHPAFEKIKGRKAFEEICSLLS